MTDTPPRRRRRPLGEIPITNARPDDTNTAEPRTRKRFKPAYRSYWSREPYEPTTKDAPGTHAPLGVTPLRPFRTAEVSIPSTPLSRPKSAFSSHLQPHRATPSLPPHLQHAPHRARPALKSATRPSPLKSALKSPSPLKSALKHPPTTPASAPATLATVAPRTVPPTGSTIRHLRVAFAETPSRLVALEAGWRAARRGLRGEIDAIKRGWPAAKGDAVVEENGVVEDPGDAGHWSPDEGERKRSSPTAVGSSKGKGSYRHRDDGNGRRDDRLGDGADRRDNLRDDRRDDLRNDRQDHRRDDHRDARTPRQERARALTPVLSPHAPPTPPSSPPPSPPRVHERAQGPRPGPTHAGSPTRTFNAAQPAPHQPPPRTAGAPSTPSPIIAHPLPPTTRSPLKPSTGTITVHPTGMTLYLPGVEVWVAPKGDVVTATERGQGSSERSHGDSDKDGRPIDGARSRKSASRLATLPLQQTHTLRLRDCAGWGDAEHALWDPLSALVAGYKRRTPRAKLYTALGDVGITCSTPPDIVLGFVLRDTGKASRTGTGGRAKRASGDDKTGTGGHGDTHVRLRYSLSAGEAVVDTSTRGRDWLRTHRVAPLGSGSEPEVVVGDDWGPVEREAVRRLKALRSEWGRYVG